MNRTTIDTAAILAWVAASIAEGVSSIIMQPGEAGKTLALLFVNGSEETTPAEDSEETPAA